MKHSNQFKNYTIEHRNGAEPMALKTRHVKTQFATNLIVKTIINILWFVYGLTIQIVTMWIVSFYSCNRLNDFNYTYFNIGVVKITTKYAIGNNNVATWMLQVLQIFYNKKHLLRLVKWHKIISNLVLILSVLSYSDKEFHLLLKSIKERSCYFKRVYV